VLHTYVTKVDQDVAHVASVSDECCKCFVPNVSSFLDVYCTCFIWVLHMFYAYVASVSFGCCICFTHML
jgi:hypothetical protein